MTATGRAHIALADALAGALERREHIPCARSDDWLSESVAVRAEAVLRCRVCPVLDLCTEAADESDARFGVWGGLDRTTHAGRRATPTPERNSA